jgi:hypothetical protein
MKMYLIVGILLLSMGAEAQQISNSGIYIKFSSKEIKLASIICTIYAVGNLPTVFSQQLQIPNSSSFYFLQYNSQKPIRLYQDGCINSKAEIIGEREFYAGDSIIVNMDKQNATIVNKSKVIH